MAKRKKNIKKPTLTDIDYIKANRRGSREAELEFGNGFISMHATHKSKKTYNRRENKQINFE